MHDFWLLTWSSVAVFLIPIDLHNLNLNLHCKHNYKIDLLHLIVVPQLLFVSISSYIGM